MPRDTGIADRCRAQGLTVIEVEDWRTRGNENFSPRGSLNHHTAGGATGNAPSLGICIRGRGTPGDADYLPGPLCNVFQARNNDIYVVAAGRANHAGSGGWRGLYGNSSVFGLEAENVGTSKEPWRPDQIETMAKVHAALIKGTATPAMVCQHREWTTRKVDAHSISVNDFRGRVAYYLANQEDDVLSAAQEKQLQNASDQAQSANVRAGENAAAIKRIEDKLGAGAPGGGLSDADIDRIVQAVIKEIAD